MEIRIRRYCPGALWLILGVILPLVTELDSSGRYKGTRISLEVYAKPGSYWTPLVTCSVLLEPKHMLTET
jgi:hypothetical protein